MGKTTDEARIGKKSGLEFELSVSHSNGNTGYVSGYTESGFQGTNEVQAKNINFAADYYQY